VASVPRIILHIGPHKTASTYIQTNLVTHRALLAAHGVAFPAAGMTEAVQHCHLGLFHALHANDLDQANRILTEILAVEARVVILSAEDFVRLPDPAIAHLATRIGAVTEVLYYYRPFPTLLPSGLHENIRQGRMMHPVEALLPHLVRPVQSRTINQKLMLDRFAAAFGVDRISVALFDEAVRDDPFRHFLRVVLGIEATVEPSAGLRNASDGPIEAEILRQYNILSHAGGWPRLEWTAFLPAAMARLPTTLRAIMEAHHRSVMLHDGLPPYAEIKAAFVDAYGARVVDAYGARVVNAYGARGRGADRRRAFPPVRAAFPFIAAEYLSIPGVTGMIQALCGAPGPGPDRVP
jgi:hypothetical protein